MSEEEYPKRLLKALERLEKEGEKVVYVFSAMPRRYMDERSAAMARVGALDEKKMSSWVVVTEENLVFIRTGLVRNRVDKFPLDKIEDVEYVDEFQDNTLKIRVSGGAENVRFYDDVDGIRFYQHMKFRDRGQE